MKRLFLILVSSQLMGCGSGDNSVYVCVSSSAYAYHYDPDCYGLNRCSHEIRKMSEKDAENYYGRSLCGYEK